MNAAQLYEEMKVHGVSIAGAGHDYARFKRVALKPQYPPDWMRLTKDAQRSERGWVPLLGQQIRLEERQAHSRRQQRKRVLTSGATAAARGTTNTHALFDGLPHSFARFYDPCGDYYLLSHQGEEVHFPSGLQEQLAGISWENVPALDRSPSTSSA